MTANKRLKMSFELQKIALNTFLSRLSKNTHIQPLLSLWHYNVGEWQKLINVSQEYRKQR
jgi:hypothetical protein